MYFWHARLLLVPINCILFYCKITIVRYSCSRSSKMVPIENPYATSY